jgi:hypothetical protein
MPSSFSSSLLWYVKCNSCNTPSTVLITHEPYPLTCAPLPSSRTYQREKPTAAFARKVLVKARSNIKGDAREEIKKIPAYIKALEDLGFEVNG